MARMQRNGLEVAPDSQGASGPMAGYLLWVWSQDRGSASLARDVLLSPVLTFHFEAQKRANKTPLASG